MSRRTLGGGRVLGSAKALSLSPANSAVSSPQVKPRALSPSSSSLSLNSQASTFPNLAETQDLTSRISLENGGTSISAAPAAVAAKLACPICSEEMVTLLQLNRHLDDVHQNLEDDRQDEVKDWFKTQMDRAKKFQPLAVLNQKLKGLEVFESNENTQSVAAPIRHPPANAVEPTPRTPDPEESVTREHWQARSLYDTCLEPSCGKRLNAANGYINCRACGKLFCNEHTMYQMKLSRSAKHDPVRGVWCRVCETCYKSREGYNDHNGVTRDQTDAFDCLRKQRMDKSFLEVSRLEKRLTRLTQMLASLSMERMQPGPGKLWSLSWQNDQRKALEQSIVSWQDDASVAKCPFCQQEFTSYSFRRHHCRTCGRVVCGDPATACSSEIPLSISPPPKNSNEKAISALKINVDVRLCKECRAVLFDRQAFEADLVRKPPDLRAYDNLVQFEKGIRVLLPRFQKLLMILQDPRRPPSPAQIAEASKVRRRLIDSFSQYDVAARRIRDMPTESPTQKQLQKAIYQKASTFLHLHMLPLKALPKILKPTTASHEQLSSGTSTPTLRSSSSPAPTPRKPVLSSTQDNRLIADTGDRNGNGSPASDRSSAAVSAMEAEEKSLRERLIVLEEQKFFVSEMIADANRRRKFDEVSSLAMNIEDLSREIDSINNQLSGLDFEALYSGGGA